MTSTLKRTPLYETHIKLGGKVVPFAGWELPVQYSGIIAEHHAVRQQAGLFDVSHMGEILVEGSEAERALQLMTCNDLSAITEGRAQYNAILNESGGVVDDIIVYRQGPNRFFVCVNASNADKDFAWFTSHNVHQAIFTNLSAQYGQVAIQGPAAEAILRKLSPQICALKYFDFAEVKLKNVSVLAARTGYTGEDGFELFIPWSDTSCIWDSLLDCGAEQGLIPCGLGARDSLRLEACYPLHGHELGDEISALESGLGWIVKLNKGEFIGRDVLCQEKERGSPRSLVGFFLDDPGIARHGDKVSSPAGETLGVVTSGTKTPTINRSLGLALLKSEGLSTGSPLAFEVRGKRLAGHVVARPFYKSRGKR